MLLHTTHRVERPPPPPLPPPLLLNVCRIRDDGTPLDDVAIDDDETADEHADRIMHVLGRATADFNRGFGKFSMITRLAKLKQTFFPKIITIGHVRPRTFDCRRDSQWPRLLPIIFHTIFAHYLSQFGQQPLIFPFNFVQSLVFALDFFLLHSNVRISDWHVDINHRLGLNHLETNQQHIRWRTNMSK